MPETSSAEAHTQDSQPKPTTAAESELDVKTLVIYRLEGGATLFLPDAESE